MICYISYEVDNAISLVSDYFTCYILEKVKGEK
jgi:hypothetical protein